MSSGFTPSQILAAVAAASGAIAVLWWWTRWTSRRDREVLRRMAPLMNDLWRPVRFMADLNSVWPDLNEEQRREIESSVTYRDHVHEHLAEERVAELRRLTRRIRSLRNWRMRAAIMGFLKDWRHQEPDELRVLMAMMERQLED